VRVLGGFAVDGVPPGELGSRKARTLLKVLALARGAPVSVDRLADVLWADDLPGRPADQVGVLVSRLRRVLGADRLTRSETGYRLATDWLDIDEVARLAARAREALAEGRVGAARTTADTALSLVRGPLLPEEPGEWAAAERAAADAVIARARAVALDAALAAGDPGGAAALAETALAHDPYDEVALRALMQAHLAAGRPASALAAYARVRHRLAEELGVPPTTETEALHRMALTAADGDTARPEGPTDPAGPGPAGGSAVLHPEERSAPVTTTGGPIVGRAEELAALDSALAEAAAGATPLVIVAGEAGIGKTTLVDWWTASVLGKGTVVLRGRCDELGRDLPLQPVADALADHLRSVGAERAATIVAGDEPRLAALLGPVAGPSATVVPDVETSQVSLFSALARAVTRAAHGGPAVLVVEDLHHASASTISWLAFARHRCPGVLLIVTTRQPDLDQLADGLTLRLRSLTVDEVAELVGGPRAATLHERSGGHPLLLAALAPLADEAGAGGELPASVRDAVAVRVDALGADVGATLRVAAVLGVDCDVDLVAQLRRLPTLEVLEHLEAAARAGLVVERGAAFAFGHDMVRDALAAEAGAARRALVHRDAARVLAARPRPDVLAVAVHARQGGDAVLAALSFVAAAEAAAARFDLVAAEDFLDQALALDESAQAYLVRARVRMSRSALDGAADDAARAVAAGGGPAAFEVAGWVAYYQRRYEEARRHADRVLEAPDPSLRASALALAGRVRHAAGDLSGAVACLSSPVPGASDGVTGVAGVWLAQVRNHQGQPVQALEALDRSASVADRLAHPWAPLHLEFNRVMALGQLGRVADATAAAARLDEAVRRSGPVGTRFRGPSHNVSAWILRWSGRAGEADDRNEAAIEVSRNGVMTEAYFVALLDLADGCLQRQAPADAQAFVARLEGLATWTGTMAWHQRHRLGLLRARLALAAGDRDAGAGFAAEVAGDAAARGAARYEWLATAVLGLADPTLPSPRLETAVDGLGHCAALDGWPLVAALGAARREERWRQAAESTVARVVAASGPAEDPVRRLATRLLEAVSAAPLGG
jgi:DNA-binding SARP family transcriptional activator